MNFYKVEQYTLTEEGEQYLKLNPNIPWGCETISTEFINKFKKHRYDEYYKEFHNPTRRKWGGVRNRWVNLLTFEEYNRSVCMEVTFKNPKFYSKITRGYQQDASWFNTLVESQNKQDMVWITESCYYTRTRLTYRCMALDALPNPDNNLYYEYQDGRFNKTDPWIGFEHEFINGTTYELIKYYEQNS